MKRTPGSKISGKDVVAAMQVVFKVVKRVPPLLERQAGTGKWEAYDPKTGRVYAIYGSRMRAAAKVQRRSFPQTQT